MPRTLSIIAVLMFALLSAGCTGSLMSNTDPDAEPAAVAKPAGKHPVVRIEGVDGTVMNGELLNGTITVECVQGPLVLITHNIHSITISDDLDVIDSDSIRVSGKVQDPRFLLKNEHGVFTLYTERLRSIQFGGAVPTTTTTTSRSSITTRSTDEDYR